MSSKKNIAVSLGALVLVAAIVCGIVFLSSAYNKGKIGNKEEKIEKSFTQQLEGSWSGKHSIAGMTFKEDGTTSLSMLGVSIDGTYSDDYNIEKDEHILTLKYSTVLGVSVERNYRAVIDEDKLTLVDTKLDSIELVYTRNNGATEEKTEKTQSTTVYNPGVDVYQKELTGKWKSSNGTNSGYEFKEDSTVNIKLLGVSYDGKYSVSVDKETNKCVLKITYVSLMGVNISNSYYVTIADDVLTLNQIGAEAISVNYVKE